MNADFKSEFDHISDKKMINEEIKSEVFRTRMLTNYREDWPNGRKGCLWFIHGRNGRNNHVILLDTFWRKGYEWQKDDEMLPYEKKFACAQYMDENVIVLSDFVAVIVSYLFTQKEWLPSKQREEDILELWKGASDTERDCWHESIQDKYSFTHLIKGDKIEIVLQCIEKLLPNSPSLKIPLNEIIKEILNMTEQLYIDNYAHNLSVEEMLFTPCQNLLLPFLKDLISDERVVEYYSEDQYCGVTTAVEDKINIEYDYDERMLFCDYDRFSSSSEEQDIYHHVFACGVVASFINYCAHVGMIKQLHEQYIDNKLDKNNSPSYSIECINFEGIRLEEIFHTYFQDIISRYDERHADDTKYFAQKDSNVDMTSIIAEEEYENELQNESINNVLYAYLREEQVEKLRKYREAYLDFLQRKFRKKEKFLWPYYTPGISDKVKLEFEEELKKRCSAGKGARTRPTIALLKDKESNKIIYRPTDLKEEHRILQEKFNYSPSYSAYNKVSNPFKKG